jgi:hypothetical protein
MIIGLEERHHRIGRYIQRAFEVNEKLNKYFILGKK